MDPLLYAGRRAIARNDRARGRWWHATRLRAEEVERNRDALRVARDFATSPDAIDRIVLGRMSTGHWIGMDPQELIRQSAWWIGASGSGKSFHAITLLLQLLRTIEDLIVIVLDLKGEVAPLLAMVIASLPNARDFLDHFYTVNPFGDGNGPPPFLPRLRITSPQPNVPKEIQATAITDSIAASVAGDLSQRIERLAWRAVSLAISLNEPLTIVSRWLSDPALFARDAQRSGDPELMSYVLRDFRKEHAASVTCLIARLDSFTFWPDTKLVLNAPDMLSFPSILAARRAIVSINLGQPPAGAERIQAFWSGFFFRLLARSILTRQLTKDSSPVLVLSDEVQEALRSPEAAPILERVISLGRFKKCALWVTNQSVAQLSKVDAALPRILAASTGIQVIFRSTHETARTVAHALPSPNARHPGRGRQALVEEIPLLPRRHALLWPRFSGHRAVFIRSPRLDLDAIRARAAAAPEDIHEAICRGVASSPREELEAALVSSHRQPPPVPPTDDPEQVDDDKPDGFPRLG